ncbi:SDR family oxidoreductase [Bryobacter aggregatus]|uniref:SDR family oxidoreductase n=1 Tax=Bryobacter aggregatus TaxID=360054 RepID=UPI0004E1452B|nr:SDR family oxidoreductase [Bryobacter aggregatus]
MKAVITGGAGFIGSALGRHLLEQGVEQVVAFDNLNSGHKKNLDGTGIALVEGDIRDYDAVLRAFAGADFVFHLAAIPSVPRSIKEPLPSHDVNINGSFNVFRAAQHAGVKRVVYAASSSAYGDTEVLPKVETMQTNPKSPYAAQKLMGEQYASVFSSCFGLETVSLRFFNVFGPRQDPGSAYSGVLSLFMKALIEGTSPTIFGDGEQSRDFTFVEDVAALVWKAAHAKDVSGRVFNAGNGNRYTLNETWKLLQGIAGRELTANYGPPRAGDVKHSQADTALAVQYLGHAPQFTFEEGLRRTFQWYKASLA